MLNLGNALAPERHLRLENVRIDIGADILQASAHYATAVKAMAPGTAPDLIVTDGDLIGPLARSGLLQDLGPLLRDQDWYKPADFYGNGLQAGTVRGKQMALPFSALIEVLLYNRPAFQARGVAVPQKGWTWDQLVTAARALTTPSSSGSAGSWGFSVTPQFPSFLTTAWQHGAQVVSDDGTQIDLSEPGTLQAMSFTRDLIQTYAVASRRDPASISGDAYLQTIADEFRDLRSGMIAMADRYSGRSVYWRDPFSKDLVVAEVPQASQKVGLGYASMLAIPAAALDPMHSLNGLRALLDASIAGVFLPARKGTDDLRKVNPLLTDSEASALSDALGTVRYLPGDFPGNAIYPLIWTNYLVPIISGQKDPSQAAKDAQPIIQGQLTRLLA
jgi:multiple sugar transport system substrate-binding protein